MESYAFLVVVCTSMAAEDLTLAGRGARVLAWFLDAAIAAPCLRPFNPALCSDRPSAALFTALWAPAMVLVFACLIAFDGGPRGATPGKRLLGIRVADAKGAGPIGYPRATIRRLGYLVGGLALCVGWLWMLFDPRRQAWHDKLANSIVVRASPRR